MMKIEARESYNKSVDVFVQIGKLFMKIDTDDI